MIVLFKAKRSMALDLRNTSPTQRVQRADVSHHALHRVGPRAALCARMSETAPTPEIIDERETG
jgi:hypothetical protein